MLGVYVFFLSLLMIDDIFLNVCRLYVYIFLKSILIKFEIVINICLLLLSAKEKSF